MNQLDRARARGAEAFRAGKPESVCPYADIRTNRGAVTWSRAWIKAWHEGYVRARTHDAANHKALCEDHFP